MNYRNAKKTLNSLYALLLDIEQKERERKGAIRFNKKNTIKGMDYNLKELANNIKEMEISFKTKTREL